MTKKKTTTSKAAAAKDEGKEPEVKKTSTSKEPEVDKDPKEVLGVETKGVEGTISSDEGKYTEEEKESLKSKENGGIENDDEESSEEELGSAEGMTYEEADVEMDYGQAVKLPEWVGFWFKEIGTDKTFVLTKDGEVLDTPHEEYKERNDWQLVEPTDEQSEILGKFWSKRELGKTAEDNKRQHDEISEAKAVAYNRHRGMSFKKLSKKISLEDLQSRKNLPLDSGRTSEFILDNGLVFSLERGLTHENKSNLIKTIK